MSLDQPAGRQPDHPVAPQFPNRWSPRSFTDRALSEAEVMSLLEAARWAPSASNHQPWRLVWALRGEAAFEAIAGTLTGNNPLWAGKAAVLVAVASKDTVTNREGVEVANRTSAFDTGAAWMSLALQAEAMGLFAHAMGGFRQGEAGGGDPPAGRPQPALRGGGGRAGPGGCPAGAVARAEKPSGRKPVEEIAKRGRF